MSSSTSLRLRLTAAQTGLDPRTHYWFKAGKSDYRRICDEAQWSHLQGPGKSIGKECRLCLAMRRTDREAGHRGFSLTYNRKGVFAPGNPPYAIEKNMEPKEIQHITMIKFAKFCAGSPNERANIITERAARKQQAHDRRTRCEPAPGGDYYGGLLKAFRKNHWETNNIHQLDEAVFDIDCSKKGNATKLRTYQALKDNYVDTWKAENASSYFNVPRADVSFGELSIRVDAEVGMETREAERAFKLWLHVDDVHPDDAHPNILDVCSYLLWEAADYAEWPRPWRPGIWDVRRSKLWEAASPRTGIREWVHECADDFIARWHRTP